MIDKLGDRMKGCYEARSKTYLTRRTPVIIRLDGKAFHTFTKGFEKPFDKVMIEAMQGTMKYLCKNIQGCVLGYTQSDEITLVLADYQRLTTDAWFDYNVQKMCSVSASMATWIFNREFASIINYLSYIGELDSSEFASVYNKALRMGALFDARCFNIPKEEVANCVLWRQQDATRNSINSTGQFYFSHKELQKKNPNEVQDMLFKEKGVNWNDFPTHLKRGSCCIKVTAADGSSEWTIDEEIPIFSTEEGRNYIESLINF